MDATFYMAAKSEQSNHRSVPTMHKALCGRLGCRGPYEMR